MIMVESSGVLCIVILKMTDCGIFVVIGAQKTLYLKLIYM
jgi:hypothetical protein